MQKSVLIVLLTIVKSDAAAGWVAAGGSEIHTAYIDAGTVRKEGSMVKVWELLDP